MVGYFINYGGTKMLDNKIIYLKKQLETAISNNDSKSADRYYNQLVKLGVPKQELQFAECSLAANKPKNIFEELKEIEELVEKTYGEYKKKQKLARILILVGLVACTLGIVQFFATESIALMMIGSIGGLGAFIYGMIWGLSTPYDTKAGKVKQQIYELHINKFDCYMSISGWTHAYIDEDENKPDREIGTGIQVKLLKGSIKVGDTLYIEGELYEVFSMYVADNEKTEVSRKNSNIIICIAKEAITLPQNLMYAIKI